jgi:hypothetical protein
MMDIVSITTALTQRSSKATNEPKEQIQNSNILLRSAAAGFESAALLRTIVIALTINQTLICCEIRSRCFARRLLLRQLLSGRGPFKLSVMTAVKKRRTFAGSLALSPNSSGRTQPQKQAWLCSRQV